MPEPGNHAGTQPGDQELERYLAGGSEISRLYRQAPQDSSPVLLDEQILDAARQELKKPARRWWVPVSAAAALLLAVGLLLRMQTEGVDPVPGERVQLKVAAPAAVTQEPAGEPNTQLQLAPAQEIGPPPSLSGRDLRQESAPAEQALSYPVPAAALPAPLGPEQMQSDEGASAAGATAAERAAPAARAAAPAPQAEIREGVLPPEVWLERIRDLRIAGRDAEAATEITLFRARYPDHVVPPDLENAE